ncbi:pseudaminic acid synthase [Leptospira broomii serovar Hurstbridge str. 5399]|uniref:Pseudaminic acid synthase n=1 Tax=Leptospira broomii serovar Hurstbridge str. 5399 TaxID=1049789 RepID=T0FGB0_9LEPT|nr:pseudaminic acid synthase [Leptospira broomii]EQA46971.1 pseudaminic acid synthase [Leptospira broomii serovar Hurstbridge str. 5399]
MESIKIGNKSVGGKDDPCFIIAELSANHNQDFNLAVETLHAMKESGADCIKLQTYTPDTITLKSDNEWFKIQKGTIWDGKTLYDLYSEAFTPWDWQPKLQEIAKSIGLEIFSSPFDESSVDFLEKMSVPAYKIASFEITDIPLIKYVASKGKPIIISTGIAYIDDINLAIQTCREAGNDRIIILKCTSSYPAPYEEINLKTIPNLSETFGVVAGLSDHTEGWAVPVAAVALGAKVVEKHFILDRKIGGPDSSFSMEPGEFRTMVDAIRNVEKAIGSINYDLSEKVITSREFSRSLFIVKDIKKGDQFTRENVRSIRPGFGMHPKYFERILGKTALEDFRAGTPLQFGMIRNFQ